ncbi:MAG TPA: hypothetical protein VF316_03885 [Polyangiaceae bacterium]
MKRVLLALSVLLVSSASAVAKADSAVVQVGRFADPPPPPPPGPTVVLVEEPRYQVPDRPFELPREDYRSPFRLHIGPSGVTTGRGFGLGLGLAADFGLGTVGARLTSAWFRPESTGTGPIAGGMGHYTAEMVLDLHKGGPWHPVIGLGFGLTHIASSTASEGGFAGIGIARIGFEYSLGLDDADVRFGFGLTGALPGPSDRELANLPPYAVASASLGIGF